MRERWIMLLESRVVKYLLYIALAIAISSTCIALYFYAVIQLSIRIGRPPLIGGIRTQTLFFTSAYTALGSWMFIAATLAFKGIVKHLWCKNKLDYEVFKLLVRMRGSSTRIRILRLLEKPMNRLMLARQLKLDWKAIDRHVEVLEKKGLIQRLGTRKGRGELYILTEKGRTALELLEKLSALQVCTNTSAGSE
ncbi:MAG: hypothetical protein J7K49_04755 [Thaumarchaeota archaeon]|nr:hypothetical protein [Nitrososphaerota archaeon]